MTNHVTDPELLFFLKREGILKIDQCVKCRDGFFRMGVVCSQSSTPVTTQYADLIEKEISILN